MLVDLVTPSDPCPQCGKFGTLRVESSPAQGVYGNCLLSTVHCQECSYHQTEQDFWVVRPVTKQLLSTDNALALNNQFVLP